MKIFPYLLLTTIFTLSYATPSSQSLANVKEKFTNYIIPASFGAGFGKLVIYCFEQFVQTETGKFFKNKPSLSINIPLQVAGLAGSLLFGMGMAVLFDQSLKIYSTYNNKSKDAIQASLDSAKISLSAVVGLLFGSGLSFFASPHFIR